MTLHPPLDRRTAAEVMTRDLLTIAASEPVLPRAARHHPSRSTIGPD